MAIIMANIQNEAMFSLSYGLYVLTAREEGFDNGCIINTAIQVTSSPNRISIAVNKSNLTHDMIMNTKKFNVSVLSESAPFEIFTHYGFQSGRNVKKIIDSEGITRSENGLFYLEVCTSSFISGEVIQTIDLGTHTLFIADVTEAKMLSDEKPVTYSYYQSNIKPKKKIEKKGYVCKVCGYVYEGDVLPDDFICPTCKHPASDFEKIN